MVDHDRPVAFHRALRGDLGSIQAISAANQADLRAAAAALASPLVLTRDATASVLRDLVEKRFPPVAAQAWASFMRRGYPEGSTSQGPISPIDIDYEGPWEEQIADVVSTLDEFGDVVDGDLSDHQLLGLLRILNET